MAISGLSKIIRGTFSLSVSTVIRLVAGFAVTAIGTRYVPGDAYGVYFLLFGLVYLLESFGNFGLGISAARFIAGASDNKEEQSKIVNNLFTFRLITLILLGVIAVIGKKYFLSIYASDLFEKFYIFVPIMLFIRMIENILTSIMQGYQLYRKMALVEIITGVSNLILVILFVVMLDSGVEGFIIAMLVSLLVAIIIRLIIIPARIRLNIDRTIITKILKFALPLQGNDLLAYLIQKVNTLIIGALLNPVYIAYIEVAMKIPESMNNILDKVHSVYFPSISQLFGQGKHHEAEDVLNYLLRIVAFTVMAITLFFILFQNETTIILFSDKYLPSAPALGGLMMILSITSISSIIAASYVAIGRPIYLIIATFTATVNIVGCMVLIPNIGLMGSVYARLIGELLINPICFLCARREKIGIKMSMYLKPALIFVSCLILYYGLSIETLIIKLFILLAYLGLSLGFSVITIHDIQDIRQSIWPTTRQAFVK